MSDKLVRIKNRYDMRRNWNTENPVLSEGEIGIDSTTGWIKIGDGVTKWLYLPYENIHEVKILNGLLASPNELKSHIFISSYGTSSDICSRLDSYENSSDDMLYTTIYFAGVYCNKDYDPDAQRDADFGVGLLNGDCIPVMRYIKFEIPGYRTTMVSPVAGSSDLIIETKILSLTDANMLDNIYVYTGYFGPETYGCAIPTEFIDGSIITIGLR